MEETCSYYPIRRNVCHSVNVFQPRHNTDPSQETTGRREHRSTESAVSSLFPCNVLPNASNSFEINEEKLVYLMLQTYKIPKN